MICTSAPGITVRRESVTLPVSDALVDWECKTDRSTRMRSKGAKPLSRLVRAGIRLGKSPPDKLTVWTHQAQRPGRNEEIGPPRKQPNHTYDPWRRSVPRFRSIFLKIPGRGKCWRTL